MSDRLLAVDQHGDATVEFFVDKNGDVQLPQIISCTMPEFGYAAVQAVATWRFAPPPVEEQTGHRARAGSS